METQTENLVIHLEAGPEADEEELAASTRSLREQLLQLNVESVDPISSSIAPPGAKGDPVTLATLAVTLAPIALTELMRGVQTWLSRHERATVTVRSGKESIVIQGSPSTEQKRVIEAFIRSRTP